MSKSVMTVLLVAAAALTASSVAISSPTTSPPATIATSSPATSPSATSPSAGSARMDVVPSCAPLPDSAWGAAKPGSGAAASNATHKQGSANGQSAKDSDWDDDNDDKDFPPLKPGQSFHLIGFAIQGSKHIDEQALIAALPEHVGDPITEAEITANTDWIKKTLTARHVNFADVTTALVQREGPDHCTWVIWGIQHIDAFSHLPFQGYWKFGGQTFSGNKVLSNEQLEKAVDLKLGERVREGAISDAMTGIQQAYDKVFPGKTVTVKGKLKLTLKPERVANFEWQIDEPSTK